MQLNSSTPLKCLAAAAALSTLCARAADTNINLESSREGLLWSDASLWSNGLPTSETSVSITIGDALNPIVLDGPASVAGGGISGKTVLDITGSGTTFLTSLDFWAKDGTVVKISDGARAETRSTTGIYSWRVEGSGKYVVDGATIAGQFYNDTRLELVNGAVWEGGGEGYNGSFFEVSADASQIILTKNFSMKGGTGKSLTLKNGSVIKASESVSTLSLYLSGDTQILDGSSVGLSDAKITHFNVADGNASGKNVVSVKGSGADRVSSVYAGSGWMNVSQNSGADTLSRLSLEGFAHVELGKLDQDGGKSFRSGDAEVIFSGDSNSLVASDKITWGDGGKAGTRESGTWLLTTASKSSDGTETFATNSSLKTNNFNVNASSFEGNTLTAGIDWAGSGNILTVGTLNLGNSTAESSSAKSWAVIRDGAEANISTLTVGSDGGMSGEATFTATGGAVLNIANLNIKTSGMSNSAVKNSAVISGSNTVVTLQQLNIGSNADSGEASFRVEDGANVTLTKNPLMKAGGVYSQSTAKSSIIVDSATLTLSNAEILMGYNDNDLLSGTMEILVKGENAVLNSANKGFFAGYHAYQDGGQKLFTVEGKNNTVFFGGNFHMNADNTYGMTGGEFRASISGEGHSFTANNINLGQASQTEAGTISFSTKGDNAENKIAVYTNAISVRGYTGSSEYEPDATTSLVFGGNTVLKKTDGTSRNVFIYLGAENGVLAGSRQILTVSGSGNEIGSSDSRALLNSKSAYSEINIIGGGSQIWMETTAVEKLGSVNFFIDSTGITTFNATLVSGFDGMFSVDFSKMLSPASGEAALLTATALSDGYLDALFAADRFSAMGLDGTSIAMSYDEAADKYVGSSEGLDISIYQDGNSIMAAYYSAVPEPAAFAAAAALAAMALAAGRRRSRR